MNCSLLAPFAALLATSRGFDNIDEMVELIQDELPECEYDENFNCKECSELEECYYKASTKSEHEFAESVNNGGYDSEEEFWENLD